MQQSIRTIKYALAAMLALAVVSPIMAAVDVNKADAVTIAKELKGVGPAKAKAIVEYRAKNGAFKSLEDLRKVSGIGDRLLEQNRGNITLGAAAETLKKGS